MTENTGNYFGYQLFHAITRDNDTTTVHFMYFPHHKVGKTQFLNRLTCILSEELLVKPNYFIIISGIKRAAMSIWNKDKRTFFDPSDL